MQLGVKRLAQKHIGGCHRGNRTWVSKAKGMWLRSSIDQRLSALTFLNMLMVFVRLRNTVVSSSTDFAVLAFQTMVDKGRTDIFGSSYCDTFMDGIMLSSYFSDISSWCYPKFTTFWCTTCPTLFWHFGGVAYPICHPKLPTTPPELFSLFVLFKGLVVTHGWPSELN